MARESDEIETVFNELIPLLTNSESKQELLDFLKPLEKAQVLQLIPLILQDRLASELIGSILEAYALIGPSKNAVRLEVIETVIQELIDGSVLDQTATEIVYMLGVDTQELPENEFVKLVQFYIRAIQKGNNLKGKWLALFPQLYLQLKARNRILVDGHVMTGMEYASEVVSGIRHTQILSSDAVPFAAFVRELNLAPDALSRFVEKLCDTIPDQPPQELPPLVYQLLFLTEKTMHLQPVHQLGKYFMEKNAAVVAEQRGSNDVGDFQIETTHGKEVQQAKATSIYHIINATSHGHPLARELIKTMRKKIDFPESYFTPFIVEVALALGGIPEFRETIDVLKAFIQKSIFNKERRRYFAWVKEINPGSNEDDPLNIIVSIMDNNTSDWSNIVIGIELLAFALLEMKPLGKRPAAGTANSAVLTTAISTGPPALGSYQIIKQCWAVGTQILLNLMKKFREVAPLALKKLIERIEHGSEEQFIDALRDLVQSATLTMLECKSSLTGLLCNMDYQNTLCSRKLFAAISPLFRHAPALRNTATLILRKLFHSCTEEARQVAVAGFLQLMKDLRFASSQGSAYSLPLSQWGSTSSQATVDIHGPQGSESNRAFCTELLILLRGCRTQHLGVKVTLYQGFPEIVSRNPDLVPGCVALLREQLDLFVDPRKGIKLEEALGQDGNVPVISEPLGHLIQALLHTLVRGGLHRRMEEEMDLDEDQDGDAVEKAVPTLIKIAKGLACTTPEEFQIDKSLDAEGLLRAQLLIAVYVAVMDFYVLRNAAENQSSAESLVSIYALYSQVESLVKKASGKATKGKTKKDKTFNEEEQPTAAAAASGSSSRKPPSEMPACYLSLKSIATLLKVLYDPSRSDSAAAADVLKAPSNITMHLWVMETTLVKCRELRNNGGVENLSSGSIVKLSCSIARSLLLCCAKQRFGGEKETAIFQAALESINDLLQFFCKFHPDKKLLLLVSMEGANEIPPGVDLDDQVAVTLEHFQNILAVLLTGDNVDDANVVKAALPLLSIVNTLSEQVEPTSRHFNDLLDWIKKICKDTEATNEHLVKASVSLLIKLYLMTKPCPSILAELAKRMHVAMGDIDQSLSLDPGDPYAIINADSAPLAMSSLCLAIDQLLSITDWMVPCIGAHSETSTAIQGGIYNRLALLISALAELVQSNMALGPPAELLLKTVAHLYTTIGKVTKQQEKVLAPKYEKLVNHLATHMWKKVPTLLTHLEETNSSAKRKLSGIKVQREALKQMKCYSSLVYAMEQCSTLIMNLAKKSKVDLSAGFKLGTSRDFRINNDLLKVVEEVDNDETGSEATTEPAASPTGGGATAAEGPAPKRAMFMRGRRGRNKLSKLGKS